MKPTPDEEEALAQGRMRAIRLAPYFSDAVYALIPWSAAGLLPPGVGTAVTASGVMLYEPEVILNQWSVDDMATGTLHEAEHIYRNHAERAELLADCDHQRWNACCDAELADDLQAMGCLMLASDILPARLGQANGLTAEHYYHESVERHAKRPQAVPPGRGACGSGAGNPFPGEEDIELPNLTKTRAAQLEGMRNDVSHAIQQAGTAPLSLKRYSAEKLRAPLIPWEARLAVLTRRAVAWKRGNLSSTYSQINRRQGGLGFGPGCPILSAPVSPVPNVCLVQDTSGSVSDADMAYTLAQAAPILRAAGGRVTFIACDAKVHTMRQVSSVGEIRKSMIGGGGTDFRPVFDALAKARPRPDVVVFSTDAFGVFPKVRPAWCQVIWLLQCQYAAPGAVPWGASIVVPKPRTNAQGMQPR